MTAMKKMNSRVLSGLIAVLAGLAGAGVAQAAPDAEPGVARISVMRGNVSTLRGDSGDWVASTVNAPVAAGDRVSTGDRSRAEIQLDFANLLRLDERSEAKIADNTNAHIQVQVARGLVNFTVLKGSEAEIEIDTPNLALRPRREGSYRILVNSDEETQVIVRSGEAEITTPQGSTTVHQGEMITVRGTDNPQYQVLDAPRNDEWDNWNKDRDHAIQNASSWQHTNRYYTGAHDLDTYGRWNNVEGYPSAVWVPAQGPGWAPYRDGRWVWEPYYGWTWVSYEPWGWAPYHYGRWFFSGNLWCWYPGPVIVNYRPIYAPAYVSFFGFGFGGHTRVGFGFGGGFGTIGWLPIGPHDSFIPWYGGNRNHFHAVNVTNVTNINNITNINAGISPVRPLLNPDGRHAVVSNLNGALSNERVRAGMSTMTAESFGNGRVPKGQQPIGVSALREGQMVAGNLPVVPTRQSLRATDIQVHPSTVRTAPANTQRFYSRGPMPSPPHPFNEDAAQLQRSIQQQQKTMQPLGRGGNTTTGNPGTPGNVGTRTSRVVTLGRGQTGEQPPSGNAGGNRVGNPTSGNVNPSTPPEQPQGWKRFGSGNPPQQTPPSRSRIQYSNQAPRQGQSQPPAPQQQTQPNGYRPFTPPPTPRTNERVSPPPPPQPQQRSPAPRESSPSSQRPPLELKKPIVTQRPSNPPKGYTNSGGGYGVQRSNQRADTGGGYRGSTGGNHNSRPSYQSSGSSGSSGRSSSGSSGRSQSSSSGSHSSSKGRP